MFKFSDKDIVLFSGKELQGLTSNVFGKIIAKNF